MLRDELQRSLREMEKQLCGPDGEPQWFVFGGLTIPCVPTSVAEGSVIDESGNLRTIDLALLARTEHFLAPGLQPVEGQDADSLFASSQNFPRVGNIIRFRWQDWRVVKVTLDSMQAHVRFDLADPGGNR